MYQASEKRYDSMNYFSSGNSGLKLPALSLGLWHNFGDNADYENMKALCFTAFDHGITHFDLANNYGPVYGSAEANMGRILKSDLMPYRNEMIISSKAGTRRMSENTLTTECGIKKILPSIFTAELSDRSFIPAGTSFIKHQLSKKTELSLLRE